MRREGKVFLPQHNLFFFLVPSLFLSVYFFIFSPSFFASLLLSPSLPLSISPSPSIVHSPLSLYLSFFDSFSCVTLRNSYLLQFKDIGGDGKHVSLMKDPGNESILHIQKTRSYLRFQQRRLLQLISRGFPATASLTSLTCSARHLERNCSSTTIRSTPVIVRSRSVRMRARECVPARALEAGRKSEGGLRSHSLRCDSHCSAAENNRRT